MHADLRATLRDSPTEKGEVEVGPLPGGEEPGRFDCHVWRYLRWRTTKRKFELKADDAGKVSPSLSPPPTRVPSPSSLPLSFYW